MSNKDRFVVAEQNGRVYVVDLNSSVTIKTLVLDLTGVVPRSLEEGLLAHRALVPHLYVLGSRLRKRFGNCLRPSKCGLQYSSGTLQVTVSFGEDNNGELYVVSQLGPTFKFQYASGGASVANRVRAIDNWDFQAGAVLVEHFEIALKENTPTDFRRLETRVLVHDANGWTEFPYQYLGSLDCEARHNQVTGATLGLKTCQQNRAFNFP